MLAVSFHFLRFKFNKGDGDDAPAIIDSRPDLLDSVFWNEALICYLPVSKRHAPKPDSLRGCFVWEQNGVISARSVPGSPRVVNVFRHHFTSGDSERGE